MLKLIPSEGPGKVDKIRRAQKKKIKKAHKINKSKSALIVRQKKVWENEKERGILKFVCVSLINFIKSTKSSTIDEVSEIIQALQRSILSLERQKIKMMRKERDKKRRK